MRLPLTLIGLALLAGGCSDRVGRTAAPEVIQTDPNDLARLKLRFGDRLGDVLSVPESVRNRYARKPDSARTTQIDLSALRRQPRVDVPAPSRPLVLKGGAR